MLKPTRIIIDFIPHDTQEYDTMGNWRVLPNGEWLIEVDQEIGPKAGIAVGIHETIEMALCLARGITEPSVSDFDKSHLQSTQPGDESDAPYRKEHEFATDIERLICRELGVDLQSY